MSIVYFNFQKIMLKKPKRNYRSSAEASSFRARNISDIKQAAKAPKAAPEVSKITSRNRPARPGTKV